MTTINRDFSDFQNETAVQQVVITNGTNLSAPIKCAGVTPLKLFIPSNFVASTLTYLGSIDGISWSNPIKEMANSADTITTPGICLDASLFLGLQFIQIQTSANQISGDVILTLVGGPVFDAEQVA
jgi:hypothetical protein